MSESTWCPISDYLLYIILPGLEIARAHCKPIRDIITWVQCFSVFMAAVHKQDPAAVRELLAYMFTIIIAAQEFEDPAWRNYDETFHEKAAATGNRKWSEIDSLIYNRIFTGHAKRMPISSPGSDLGQAHNPPQSLQGHYTDPFPPKRTATVPPALPPSPRSDMLYLKPGLMPLRKPLQILAHVLSLLGSPPQGILSRRADPP